MPQEESIEPANKKWASSNIFASTEDGSLRFYVDYGKFNSTTVIDSYPPQWMDERIDALEQARILLTVAVSSRY